MKAGKRPAKGGKGKPKRTGFGHRLGTVSDHEAHHLVESALARGQLTRPDHCEKCKRKPPPFSNGAHGVQAHHDDYNHPLRVRWLCKSCHHNWHAANVAIPKRYVPPAENADLLTPFEADGFAEYPAFDSFLD